LIAKILAYIIINVKKLKKTQQEISSLIEQSYETEQRARGLWEESKRKVEKAIEDKIRK